MTVEVFDTVGAFIQPHELVPEITWAPDGGHVPYTDEYALAPGYSIPDVGKLVFSAKPNVMFTADDLDVRLLEIARFSVSGETGTGTLVNHDTLSWAALTVVVAAYGAMGAYAGSCDQRLEAPLQPGAIQVFRIALSCPLMETGLGWRTAYSPFTYHAFVTRGKVG